MKNVTSIYLDCLRAVAAFGVFFFHFSYLGFSGFSSIDHWTIGRFGVIIFFVMSGYVISYVSKNRHNGLSDYMEARFARLFSVFLPALVLTVILDAAGSRLDPSIYQNYPKVTDSKIILYIPFFITFLFENSFFSLRWLSNGPAWSIAYEFWYYVVFGIYTFYNKRFRGPILLIVIFLAGWKILLLSPVWIAGVMIHKYQKQLIELTAGFSVALIALSIAIIAILCTPLLYSIMEPLRQWGIENTTLGLHSFFLSDYLFAIPIAGLLVGIISAPTIKLPSIMKSLVSTAAGFSFSLYLFHVPIILFLKSTKIYSPDSIVQSSLAALFVIFLCYFLAKLTEDKKSFWRKGFKNISLIVMKYNRERVKHA